MANTKNITTIKSYDLAKPQEMTQMANRLKDYVVRQGLYTPIMGKNYVQVEGWQFAGGLLGLIPRVVKVEDISKQGEIKWMAQVEIVNTKNQECVGTGFAVCSNKENKKKSFDEYAILSMAQTRAIGKAYRNLIGWVMKLAGYEGTPAEEIKPEAVKSTPSDKNDRKGTNIPKSTNTVDYKAKLKAQAIKMGWSGKTQKEMLEFINDKCELKVATINSQRHAQILLGQLLQAK